MRQLRTSVMRTNGGESRASALWGGGSRAGESRSSALWGGGSGRSRGRGTVTLTVALVALLVPVAASAKSSEPKQGSYVAPGLLEHAKQHPGQKLRVIVQSRDGVSGAEKAARGLGSVKRQLGAANGVALELPAAAVERLARTPGLSITFDAKVRLFAPTSTQAWTKALRFPELWSRDEVTCAVDPLTLLKLDASCIPSPAFLAPQPPAIAIVDSGVDTTLADVGSRVVASVDLTSGQNSRGDGRGHGTFVAGIAAGAAPGFAGAAPNAPVVSLDVMDDAGEARVSDVIAAVDWIIANKDAHNIRVANFSLGAPAGSIRTSPLNHAVQRLWLSGVVVVASAGNYGVDGQARPVVNAPANDPFVITVGATDVAGTTSLADDTVAPWSVWGRTLDGFGKPDVSAAGRYMIGPVPATATLATERPGNVVAPGYMRLSGTSFAAPVVSGLAAQILARNPGWTPDQVKGAIMLTARAMPLVSDRSGGVGVVDAAAAVAASNPPNPNAGLRRFVVADPAGGAIPVFDSAGWAEAAAANAAWNEAAWNEAAWAEAGWAEAGWAEAGWAEAGWADNAADG